MELRTMNAEPLDHANPRANWQANERELSRIDTMPGLDRELHASIAERIEVEQDRIEWQLGFDRPGDAESRRWSGI
jgi:hypothetical protein